MVLEQSKTIIPVSECDYLEEDNAIRGQNYVCMSLLSPEKILEDKNVYIFSKFTENFCDEVNQLFNNMMEKYKDDGDAFQSIADRYRFLFNKKHMQEEYKYYLDEKSHELTKEFNEKVDYQTNIRGIKVRGSYDSMKEAQIRCEVLKRKDKNHNIFIAQVGCWCPWDPNVNEIGDQHYAEDQLNTLMKKYRENQSHKDEVFEDRKVEMVDAQKEKVRLSKENKKEENNNVDNDENIILNSTTESSETKIDQSENVVDKEFDELSISKEENIITNTGIGEDNVVVENYDESNDNNVNEKVFDDEDPWIKSKGENTENNSKMQEID